MPAKKIRAIHETIGAEGGFEGFQSVDYIRMQNTVTTGLNFDPDTELTAKLKVEIEQKALKIAHEICEDKLKVHWNDTPGRISFTLYPAKTSYDPRFAPGCTITLK